MKHFVVTIEREFGSLGLAIGKKLADLLNVEYYDQDLVELAALKTGANVRNIYKKDEAVTGRYGAGLVQKEKADIMANDLIEVQSKIITEIAGRESCVIIGRCADFILSNRDDCFNVYIYAPYHIRYNRIAETRGLPPDETIKLIETMDRKRNAYYLHVTGIENGTCKNKDLLLNSHLLGIERSAEILKKALEIRFHD